MPIEMNFRSPHFIDTPSMTDLVKKGITDPIRQRAEQAQKDLLFQQQQEEYNRKLAERSGMDAYTEAMNKKPGEVAGWITDRVTPDMVAPMEVHGDIAGYEAAKKAGALLPTLTDAAGNALTDDQVTQRLGMQANANKLLLSAVGDETRLQQTERAIEEARKAAGGFIPHELKDKYAEARAAEITAQESKEKSLREQMKAVQDRIDKVQDDYATKGYEAQIKSFTDVTNKGGEKGGTRTGDLYSDNTRGGSGKKDKLSAKEWAEQKIELSDKIGWYDTKGLEALDTELTNKGYSPKERSEILWGAYRQGTIDNTLSPETYKVLVAQAEDALKSPSASAGGSADSISETGWNTEQTSRGVRYGLPDPGYMKAVAAENAVKLKKLEDELKIAKMSPEDRQDIAMKKAISDWLTVPEEVKVAAANGNKAAATVPETTNSVNATEKEAKTLSKVMAAAGGSNGKGNGTPVGKQGNIPVEGKDEPKTPAVSKESAKKAVTVGEVTSALDAIWDKDANTRTGHRLLDNIARFATDEQSPRTFQQSSLGKTDRVLRKANVIKPDLPAKENVKRLETYLEKGMSDESRELVESLMHDYKMKASKEYREEVGKAQREAALTGVISSAAIASLPLMARELWLNKFVPYKNPIGPTQAQYKNPLGPYPAQYKNPIGPVRPVQQGPVRPSSLLDTPPPLR